MKNINSFDFFVESLAKSKTVDRVMYMGFGLKLADCLEMARKLRDDPYPYDEAGEIDYKCDLNALINDLDRLYREFVANKDMWGGR